MQNYRSVSYIKQSHTREVTPEVSIYGRALVSSWLEIAYIWPESQHTNIVRQTIQSLTKEVTSEDFNYGQELVKRTGFSS